LMAAPRLDWRHQKALEERRPDRYSEYETGGGETLVI
jgi:hypothetical protein